MDVRDHRSGVGLSLAKSGFKAGPKKLQVSALALSARFTPAFDCECVFGGGERGRVGCVRFWDIGGTGSHVGPEVFWGGMRQAVLGFPCDYDIHGYRHSAF